MRLAVALLSLCIPAFAAGEVVNDICWSEPAPDYAAHLGVASAVVEYCGVDDQATPNTLRVIAFDAQGAPLPTHGYKATGAQGELRETVGASFVFGGQAELGEVFLEYDLGAWGTLAACTSSDEAAACTDAGRDKCESLGSGTIRQPYTISYVKGTKMLSCRFQCTNQSGWYYANCSLPAPPASPQPAPTCPCDGQPNCQCGG